MTSAPPPAAHPSPETLRFAVITPSFRLDLDQCRLLVESGTRYLAQHVRHCLIVDRRDQRLFAPLSSARVQVMCVEDILPWWLRRVPLARKWWLNLKGRPLRNWMLQQIVKLSVPTVLNDDVFLFTDSDCFFARPFDPRDQIVDGRAPLFREHKPEVNDPANTRWKEVGARLLGLPGPVDPLASYVGNLIPWRRENGLALIRRIEETSGRSLVNALSSLPVMSEYVIHGMFVEHVLGKDAAGVYFDDVVSSLSHWATSPLDEAGLRALKARLEPQHITVMISAKSRTPIHTIRKVFVGE